MDISELTFRLILLMLPGVLAYIIIDLLTSHKKHGIDKKIAYSMVLAFAAYGVEALFNYFFYPYLGWGNTFNFLELIADKTKSIDMNGVLKVIPYALLEGLLLSRLINRGVLYRYAKRWGVTFRHGFPDTLSYLQAAVSETRWVGVRDLEDDLLYYGYMAAYSEYGEKEELFLIQVIVYRNSTGKELYQIPGVLISKEKSKLTLEFPGLE